MVVLVVLAVDSITFSVGDFKGGDNRGETDRGIGGREKEEETKWKIRGKEIKKLIVFINKKNVMTCDLK